MNTTPQTTLAQRSAEAVQARLALRLTAALDELHAKTAHPDVDTRLRFAHDQALAAARRARGTVAAAAPTITVTAGGAAILGGGPGANSTPWWLRLSSLLPLAVLLAGMVLIEKHYTRAQIDAAVEVDAAILADDLPPEAYRDRGFVEFLKTARP
jgi:Protein of unknown function (DUF3619)